MKGRIMHPAHAKAAQAIAAVDTAKTVAAIDARLARIEAALAEVLAAIADLAAAAPKPTKGK